MLRRLPLLAFATLAAATVGAFFVVQHLKAGTPLINGFPRPSPPADLAGGHGLRRGRPRRPAVVLPPAPGG